jgi:hypothetical protein
VLYVSGTGFGHAWREAYHGKADRRLTANQRERRDKLARRGRTAAEEREWRVLSYLPDVGDPDCAVPIAAAFADVPYAINFDCNKALNDEESAPSSPTFCALPGARRSGAGRARVPRSQTAVGAQSHAGRAAPRRVRADGWRRSPAMARGAGAFRSDRSRLRHTSRRRRSGPLRRRRQTVPARRHVPAHRVAEPGALAPAVQKAGAGMPARVVKPRQ